MSQCCCFGWFLKKSVFDWQNRSKSDWDDILSLKQTKNCTELEVSSHEGLIEVLCVYAFGCWELGKK